MIDAFNEGVGRCVAPLLAVITFIVIYDIAMRFVMGRPSEWVFDITKMLFSAHFMLLAAYGLLHGSHVEVDVITRLFDNKKRTIINVLGYLIFFIPFIWMLIYYGWAFFERSFSRGETTYGMTAIPLYPIKGVILVSAILLLIQVVSVILKCIHTLKGSKP
ncbi:TRAP transporter small permease subunit [Halomonas sp. wenzhen-202101]|uniref:TRAP transporter small permease protein n=2 Tax=Halomonadaceae TaxID=28256 RepID=A0ABT2ECB9_9GAMM|nr:MULTISPECIES: TRAP transporter small permease subunit [Halomonas]MCS2609222.1 TRAP transporter small permease subunit [Halomonas dongshanensis]UYG00661.1 TRAP transporter small permease subunit [Halomonas sp. GD1P12]WNL38283.1 TRAP transporter small permease subunit [Halomonas sp. PAMB 3232]